MAVRSLNKVMIIGNLTRDPNLRFTPSGTAVCSFGVATNRSWMPSDGGDRVEKVDFHNIVAWSKLAEICGQLLHKGDKVYVEGRLQTRDWKTEDGSDRRVTEVVIDNMILLRSPHHGSSNNDDDDYDDSDDQADEPEPEEEEVEADDQDQKGDEVADDIPF
ncbi:MAG: single-stranded DNA-binding protein [Candidatus Pacebacteria bacterium]|nr:single-stranded DNA-binding protein [Candidatus Paceibacterota bacterium]